MGMSEVHVVWWQWHDRSACGFIKAFESAARAQELLDILRNHACGREYCLTVVPYEAIT
jgi:hypothetical protein